MEKDTNTSIAQYKHLVPILIFIGCFVLLYFDTIVGMIHDWDTNDNYSHGYLIPFITAYLIWKEKEILAAMPIKPSNMGLMCLVGSLLFFVITNIGAELFTMRFSMILVLLSGVYFLMGIDIVRVVFLPIIYLIFMIPFPAIIWNKIAFPLKMFATKIAVMVIQLLQIPVFNEGNIIHLSNTTLEVVDACSGLRSLVSLLALSAAFTLISEHPSKIRKAILFLSAVPIAIFLNIFRLSLTAVLAKIYGPQVAQGFLHDISGIIVFIAALGLLMILNNYTTQKK
ncbi:exosortase/archaeosortase family protein [Desulfatiferula olefinivorans]